MMVKICGITNAEDARAAVDAGASALGFNFYPQSPRYVLPEVARAISEKFTIRRVGVFVDTPAAEVSRIMEEAGMDIAQIYRSPLPRFVRTWRARNMDATFDLAELNDPSPEAFVLDSAVPGVPGGTGQTFDWNRVPRGERKIILAGGLDASNVAAAITLVKPWGVDACSRLESSPGRKDHKLVKDFVKAAMAVRV